MLQDCEKHISSHCDSNIAFMTMTRDFIKDRAKVEKQYASELKYVSVLSDSVLVCFRMHASSVLFGEVFWKIHRFGDMLFPAGWYCAWHILCVNRAIVDNNQKQFKAFLKTLPKDSSTLSTAWDGILRYFSF